VNLVGSKCLGKYHRSVNHLSGKRQSVCVNQSDSKRQPVCVNQMDSKRQSMCVNQRGSKYHFCGVNQRIGKYQMISVHFISQDAQRQPMRWGCHGFVADLSLLCR
jgi:hypothetical protein